MTSKLNAVSRMAWPDAGRGIAILLVVLLHSTDWLVEAQLAPEWWDSINQVLATVRLPMFFTIAGLFAVKWVSASWADLLSAKVATLAWIFVLWTIIDIPFQLVGLEIQGADIDPLAFILRSPATIFWPRSELWFIWALAIFFVLARLSRRLNSYIQIAIALIVSVAAFAFPLIPNIGWQGVLHYYLYFLLGIYLPLAIRWIAETVQWWLCGIAVIVWIPSAILVTSIGTLRPLLAIVSLMGLCVGLIAARSLARVALLRRLGSETLPVYLAHTPVIIAAVLGLSVFPRMTALDSTLPLLLAALAVVAALGVRAVAPRWFYDLPTPLSALLKQRR